MKLIDFLNFEPFNRMRAQMGTEQLGQFELFDPLLHLTGDERSVLVRTGLQLPRTALGRLLDHSLCYKNSRIAVLDDEVMHVAMCERLPDKHLLMVGTDLRALGKSSVVCSDCLQILNYQGYDEHKARKERYNQQVIERFSLVAFWSDYTLYPLNRGREKVKPLDQTIVPEKRSVVELS